jgi:hypothetical protein
MQCGIARLVALTCVTILVGGCQADRPLATDADQPTLAALAAGGLGTPSSLTSTATSNSQINLTWADNSGNETGFELQRSTTGPAGAFTVLATTGASVRGYTDTGLSPLTQYCYRVRALRVTSGNTKYSGFSNTACATIPAPGAIQVTAVTSGSDPDPDGYFVRVDGVPDEPIGANATITITGVSSGDHTVWLHGVRWNCSVDGANPRAISVTSGATTEIAFTVTCEPAISLQVTVVTTGVDFDANGYRVAANQTCWGTPDCVRCPTCGVVAVPANGTATISGLDPADYLVELSGVASNCTVSESSSRIVAVPGTVAFDVACGPIPPGTEICENGLDDDGDGLTDSEDPDCQLSCEVAECMSAECPAGHVCGHDGCCVPHCGDGAWNGDEADVDCGGACEAKCLSGQMCSTGFDCASGNCVGGRCP